MKTKRETPAEEKTTGNELKILSLILQALTLMIAAITLIITTITFLFNFFPQLIPNNANLLEKANAGNCKAQIELADYSFLTGAYSDAVYWYRQACSNQKNTDYRVLSLNNLGYIYAHGYGFSAESITLEQRLGEALSLFDKAMNASEDADDYVYKAAMNKYILLVSFDKNTFKDYDDELEKTYDFLCQKNRLPRKTIQPYRRIKSQETIYSASSSQAYWGENSSMILTGATAVKDDNGSSGIQYVYLKTEYYNDENEDFPVLEYIRLPF